MGILVIVIATILESFQIIICYRLNFNSELFKKKMSCTLSMFLFVCILLFFLTPFQYIYIYIYIYGFYLYLLVNLSNESNFY